MSSECYSAASWAARWTAVKWAERSAGWWAQRSGTGPAALTVEPKAGMWDHQRAAPKAERTAGQMAAS